MREPDRDDDDQGPGLIARFELSLSGLRDDVRGVCDRMDRLARRAQSAPVRRLVVPQSGPVAVVSGSVLIADLGAPSPGREWIVRRLSVSDASGPRTTITGATFADWYSGRQPTGGILPSSAQWVWTQQALPAVDTFTSDSVYVTSQDHLICAVTGATTTGQQLMVSAEVWDREKLSSVTVRDI